MMNLQHISESLRNNQQTSLRVVLTPRISKEALAEFIAAVQANESVTEVEVLSCGSFLLNATESLWQCLLGAFLALPNLESFLMRGCSTASSYNTPECSIPMKAFSSISSSSLKVFGLQQLVLIGNPMHLQGALQGKTSLREFQFSSVGFLDAVTEDAQTTSCLEGLLQALSALPLENLEVSGTYTPLGFLEEVPSSLLSSKTLQRLSISDFVFPETALASVANDLATNFCLHELAISGNLTTSVAHKLQRVWKHNKTLEAIALRVDNFDDEDCTQALANAIGGSHLKVVSLCNFFGGSLSEKARITFSKMLERNVTIEYLYVPCPYTDQAFWDNVRLYCGLNSCGPRRGTAQKKKEPEGECASSASSACEISRAFYIASNKNATQALTPKSASSSKPLIKLVAASQSPGKRHQKLVEEARTSKRRKFPVVPTQGLSSMLIR